MTKLTFKLTRIAKGRGGDRYEATIDGEPRPVVIYLPQYITRSNNKPAKEMEVTITPTLID